MSYLPEDTWLRLVIWLEVGLIIYSTYGWRRSRLADSSPARQRVHAVLLAVAVLAFVPTMVFAVRVFGHVA
jgi:hypothetical protein